MDYGFGLFAASLHFSFVFFLMINIKGLTISTKGVKLLSQFYLILVAKEKIPL